ncbi:hypothetical protein BDP27DRAFT_1355267 [Rhodocollybia butyracea]|uniref:Uncharacterized protein n=1 Tax=Rhodocollybia butyracea TaxID=206335 RepID=A0A9P5TWD6_9AGAR|nr:hypothetical protein BDP27DRAFT_1355267 [Rhodocollybia butyracea]
MVGIFCLYRLVVFIIQAILTRTASVHIKDIIALIVADEALFSIGFVTLLYVAFAVVHDPYRQLIYITTATTPTETSSAQTTLHTVLQNRTLYQFFLFAAVLCELVGISQSIDGLRLTIGGSTTGTLSSTSNWVKASILIIFLATLIQVFHTVNLIWLCRRAPQKPEHLNPNSPSASSSTLVFTSNQLEPELTNGQGSTCTTLILSTTSILLLIRGITSLVITFQNQNDPIIWYTLIALPELLCVVLYAVPSAMALFVSSKSGGARGRV